MGISRHELADFHRPMLIDDMMQVMGVDFLAAIDVDGGQSYVRARAGCRGCTCKTVCRRWLLDYSQGSPQDFCPNADFFRAIEARGC
jgi:hypothetical protein